MKTRKQPKLLTVRIPANLPTIENLLAGEDLKPDKLRAILHQIFLAWLNNKRIEKINKRRNANKLQSYFPVSSEILKEIAGKRYSDYVRFLERAGIIRIHRNNEGGIC